MSVFARLPPRLQEAIVARLGWSALRPVQELAGEALLDGHNAVVLAPTAGGKTEAAVFPALAKLLREPPEGVGVLYVAPIKALLNNQAGRLGLYAEMVGLRRFVWHGDTPASARKRFLRGPADLLMTTPESLEVMLVSRRVAATALFADLRLVIVDEVHALAGSDRGAHLMSVVERLVRRSRHDVQRVGLSATVGNPEAILRWIVGSSERRGVVVDPPAERARRDLLVALCPALPELAADAARMARGRKSLLFCQSRAVTEAVAQRMRTLGVEVFVHHSAVSREEREAAEDRFQVSGGACIVCTSTLELGIDVGDLDRVFQVDAPDTVSAFLQRMGRTGRRAGQVANTVFLCQTEEAVLQAAALIELAREHWVEPVPMGARCWPVLVHQLFALALEGDGARPDDAWSLLSSVPDLAGIDADEFKAVVDHMVGEGYLYVTSGRFVLGDRAERDFGRHNFMELYAVFSSPRHYTVTTPDGRELGELEQAFVDRLVEDASSFLLGGRAWLVARINHRDRRLLVTPAPRGRRPSWGGFVPQFLGFEVCQRMRRLVEGDGDLAYVHPSAAAALASWRQALGGLLLKDDVPVEAEGESATCWTFAGGRINATLRTVLGQAAGVRVVADNLRLRTHGPGAAADLRQALDELRDPDLWGDETLWEAIRQGLPPYRLSKFQGVLPPWAQQEMLEAFLLDRAGAAQLCGAA